MNLKILVVGLGAVASLLLALGAGLATGSGTPPRAELGEPSPDFSLASVTDGAAVTLHGLRGRPVVLNFWATWCEGCQEEHDGFQALARELDGRVRFVGLSLDESEESVRAFLKERGSAYPVLLDRKAQVASAFGTTGVPQTFIVDSKGVLVASVVGKVDASSLREKLKLLLEAEAERPRAQR